MTRFYCKEVVLELYDFSVKKLYET